MLRPARIKAAVGAAALVALLALVALVAPTATYADVQVSIDAHDDTSSSVDIWRVRVDNSTAFRNRVVVGVQQDRVRIGDSIDIFFDTRPRDPGPEFWLGGSVASEYLMRHAERWRHLGPPVNARCGYRLRINESTDRSRAVVSRRCLGSPGKVRVAVKVTRGTPGTSHDWAKAPRTWLPWVRR